MSIETPNINHNGDHLCYMPPKQLRVIRQLQLNGRKHAQALQSARTSRSMPREAWAREKHIHHLFRELKRLIYKPDYEPEHIVFKPERY